MTAQTKSWSIFRKSDNALMEGGFSTRDAAEDYMSREYCAPDELGIDSYYVARVVNESTAG